MIATDCHAEALADYEQATALPDYRLATVAVLRAVGYDSPTLPEDSDE